MSRNSSAKYFQNNKERLQKTACERYESFSKKEKEKQLQYGRKQYKNLPEDNKKRLVEYRKYYYKVRRNALL